MKKDAPRRILGRFLNGGKVAFFEPAQWGRKVRFDRLAKTAAVMSRETLAQCELVSVQRRHRIEHIDDGVQIFEIAFLFEAHDVTDTLLPVEGDLYPLSDGNFFAQRSIDQVIKRAFDRKAHDDLRDGTVHVMRPRIS